MMQIKKLIINYLVSASNPAWKLDKKIKVAIAVNDYFTADQWISIFTNCQIPEVANWDVVYCKNKIEVYRHFKDANICFIFGLGDFLINQVNIAKMVYFPLLGLEFLNRKTIPINLTIEQPPPFSAQSIAEYCLSMAIILTRNLHQTFENRFRKKWKQSNILPLSVVSITQCKIGVLGLGKVGKVIAVNFKNIGCAVIGCDLSKPNDVEFLSAFYSSDMLIDFISKIDILIISLPLNESTTKIIDKIVIQKLGKNKYIINVSRGEIIDEQALIQALSSNNLKGAALDVFIQEPLPGNSPLYRCKNVILTPHIAGNINLFVNEIQQDFIHKAVTYSKNV
jgi:lactate dehydrogenase-like 2-hydroxyacid dehydrogenase